MSQANKPPNRLDRISRLVDQELARIEGEPPPVDLGRLEVLARLVRQLELRDTAEPENPYAGLPDKLLKQVLKHAETQKNRQSGGG